MTPMTLARVSQLTNKTNQFNLTTRRYTEAEVERMASDRQAIALALRLEDKFGDSGLISVVLARPDAAIEADELLIDSWLMSCRVLGRQVESAVLGVLEIDSDEPIELDSNDVRFLTSLAALAGAATVRHHVELAASQAAAVATPMPGTAVISSTDA